ncbi:MAG: hypothetical protein ACR2HP_18510 [Ilumatobacteraceae bacterium]
MAWPSAVPVRLADVGECSVVPAAAVRPLLAGSEDDTYFEDGGAVYSLSAVQRYPGRTC